MKYRVKQTFLNFHEGEVMRWTGKRLVKDGNEFERLSSSVDPKDYPDWFEKIEEEFTIDSASSYWFVEFPFLDRVVCGNNVKDNLDVARFSTGQAFKTKGQALLFGEAIRNVLEYINTPRPSIADVANRYEMQQAVEESRESIVGKWL